MKRIVIPMLLFAISASSQKVNIDTSVYKVPKFKHQPMKPTPLVLTHLGLIGAGAAAGKAQGQNDVLDNNRHAFAYRHKDLSPAWWDKTVTAPRLNQQSWFKQNFLAGFQDLWHQNQMAANTLIGVQFGLVGVLSMDDFNRHKRVRWGQLILYVLEANAARMIAKRLTLEYYDVF